MNILIVDDDPTSLKLLRAQLESEGHTVFEAHDGVDALALLEHQRVDAVISDILMPRMDGYRLCHEIRRHARLHDLPIIIYTYAYTSRGDEELALEMGADKYFKKPLSLEILNAALHEIVSKPHAAPRPDVLREVEVLKQYNERLVSKLKEKNTELQAQTEALRLSDAAMTATANAIVITDRDGSIVWANPAFSTLTDYTVAEAVGKNPRDLVKSGQQERAVYEEMWATILAGRVWHGQIVNRRKDGSLYPEEQTITPVRDANGEITHFIAIKQDISERKQAEQELRAAEEQFRGLVEQSIVGIYIIQDGKFAYVSPRFAEIHGFAGADELIGLDPLPLLAEKDRATITENQRRLLAGEAQSINYDFTALRKDGSEVEVGVSSTRATYLGRPAIVGMMPDISEKKRAQE